MRFIGVQLDLQRQYETPEFIEQFLDFIAEHHYNFLMLSLGDRVRTKSYRFRKEYFYTGDEIRRIVAYGASRGVEVFPCLPTLGHAEDFLSHPELEELAELRYGTKGRWGNSAKIDFCISNPAVERFLERYCCEIAALFPSAYFHIGFDEAWNIGFCELCRPQAQNFKGESALCRSWLLKIHRIVTDLGKRVMMWDDMFEYYPDMLETLPRDILMVNWQYQRNVRRNEAHFADLAIEDRLARYRKLGFEYVIAPADYNIANVRSFCRCPGSAQASGGLLTLWCKHIFSPCKSFPVVAYAGALFHGETEAEAWKKTAQCVFGKGFTDSAADAALRLVYESSWIHGEMLINEQIIRSLPFFGHETVTAAAVRLAKLTLEKCSFAQASHTLFLEDLILALNGVLIREEILQLFRHDVEDAGTRTDEFTGKLTECLKSVEEQIRAREKFWNRIRPGVEPCEPKKFYEWIMELCRRMSERLAARRWVRVRYCLPVQYGMPRTRIQLRIQGEWLEIGCGYFRMPRDGEEDWNSALFEFVYPVEKEMIPDAVRLEVDGFGGTGICHVEYRNGNLRMTPRKVLEQSGKIADAEYLLTDDAKICRFGSGNIHGDFSSRSAVSERHSVTLLFHEYYDIECKI